MDPVSLSSRTGRSNPAPSRAPGKVLAFPARGSQQKSRPRRWGILRSQASTQHRKPVWLTALIFLQHVSSVATFGMVTASLVVYIWTVYTQQLWNREHRKLVTLQRNERQLIGVNESLKEQLAQQADAADNGLVAPMLESSLFMKPAPGPYLQPVPKEPTANQVELKAPVGY